MQRTQIYLPEDLRKAIDIQRKKTGKSLSDYSRDALKEKIAQEKNKETDLKELAEKIFAFGKKQAQDPRNKKRADEWIKQIREDRRLDDEHVMKRIKEARRSSKSK